MGGRGHAIKDVPRLTQPGRARSQGAARVRIDKAALGRGHPRQAYCTVKAAWAMPVRPPAELIATT